MTYEWDFYTLGGSSTEVLKDCHRGPMTDIELRMMYPFIALEAVELHRRLLLNYIVSSHAPAIRTRECVLRVINGELGPTIPLVYKDKNILQALICEKRRATDIEADLKNFSLDFNVGVDVLIQYGFSKENGALLTEALASNSPISRVAGRCAIVLAATIIEMGS